MGCNTQLPDKDLSQNNISSAELSFPNTGNKIKPIKLDSIQLNQFAHILSKRQDLVVDPKACYTLLIQLKIGGSVQYRTDGRNFVGYDDSSDLPFSFSIPADILTEVFHIIPVDNCR